MEWHEQIYAFSVCRDWNMAQGFSNPADETVMIRRDLNIRKVSVENSSPDQGVGCAVTTYYEGPLPKIQFRLSPGEVKYIGINSIGSPMQFLWYVDLKSGKPLGTPIAFRTDCNQFVLRQGLQKWFCHTFQTAGFKG
jgi:hypothetical protein